MINRGEILRKRVSESGIPKRTVAERAGIGARTLYNWFEIVDVGLDNLKKIGKVINHDFDIDLYPQKAANNNMVAEPEVDYNVNWKEKYYDLLETHNKLLNDMTYLNRDLGSILETELRGLKKVLESGKAASETA